jgi:hypothetical protein
MATYIRAVGRRLRKARVSGAYLYIPRLCR